MSKIAWTDATWNPVVGCSKYSPGCLNCYAETMAARLAVMLPKTCGEDSQHLAAAYANVLSTWAEVDLQSMKATKVNKCWSGSVEFISDALEKPLHWKKPRRIFICSMGDLFHPSVPFEWIDRVMAVVALCPQHTFQTLTKRPERMAEYYKHIGGTTRRDWVFSAMARILNKSLLAGPKWPLPNLWLGVTAENQAMADKRIPILLNIPAAKRFVSIEPMLEGMYPAMIEHPKPKFARQSALSGLDWVIVGCESGPGRRECKQEWIGSIVDQCREAGVKCFVKQVSIGGKVSHDPAEWPEGLRVREY